LLRRAQDRAGSQRLKRVASRHDHEPKSKRRQTSVGKVGLAVVRGDPGAFDKLVAELSKSALKSFNTNRVGLDDTRRGELASRTFRSAAGSIRRDWRSGCQWQPSSGRSCESRPFKSRSCKGTRFKLPERLAGKGNESALEMLLNPDQYGILLSGSVFALTLRSRRRKSESD